MGSGWFEAEKRLRDSVLNRVPAKEVKDFHENDDVDSGSHAHHHTLGKKSFQAAPGDHTHEFTKVVIVSPNGTRYQLTVTDGGVLGTVAL